MSPRTLLCLFLLCSCVFAARVRGAEEPPKATPVTAEARVPDNYLLRWVLENEYYEATRKLLEESPDMPEAWSQKKALPALQEALRAVKDNFANVDLLGSQLRVPNGDLKFSANESARLRTLFQSYLRGLKVRFDTGDKTQNLAWHGMACTALFDNRWPEACREWRFERGVPRLKAELLWRPKLPAEWAGSYRVHGRRLLVMEEKSWRLLDLFSRKWSVVPLPEGGEIFRLGMDDKSLAGVDRSFDFAAFQWRKLPEEQALSMQLYLDDPVRAGAEWIVFYKNPPHYNLEKVENFSTLPAAEQQGWIESLKDRFYFQHDNGTQRNLALEMEEHQWLVMPSGRLFVTEFEEGIPHLCQKKERFLAAEDASNAKLSAGLEGAFNGTWEVWQGESGADAVLLEQSIDYDGNIPVRAAVYDLGARKWELLWNDPSPQVPPPPPGVLEKVLSQPPRWDLPAALTRPGIGLRVKTRPVLSRGGDAFILSETRDCLAGTPHHGPVALSLRSTRTEALRHGTPGLPPIRPLGRS
jgi:hypothetical protein